MAETKPLSGAGLRGQTAGETALATVGKTGAGLTYRGFGIAELAEKATFEEVAYLLLRGKLPNRTELSTFTKQIKAHRALPDSLKKTLELIPANTHPMDVLRTGVSFLGNLEPEPDFGHQQETILRLLAVMPSILLYWYRFSHGGQRIETATDDESIAGHFLHLLHGKKPGATHERVMQVSLILYAEHEFNASTFTARVVASTLSDMHSCVTAAIGALRGPLHGGANEAAMKMIEQWKTPDEAEAALLKMIAAKAIVMGFGHPVYRESDPRSPIIQAWAKKLATEAGDTKLFDIAERTHAVMSREKKLFPNADFYHAPAYRSLGIPTELFTPIFVCSRITGWCAHIMEQRAKNRIIRPSADYTGPMSAVWVEIDQRP